MTPISQAIIRKKTGALSAHGRQRAGLGQGCLCVLGDSWPFPTAEAVFRQFVDDKNVSGNWVVGGGAATN